MPNVMGIILIVLGLAIAFLTALPIIPFDELIGIPIGSLFIVYGLSTL